MNRLASVDYGDGETQGYTFDNMGNRLSKTDNVTGNESSTFNAANMLLTRGSNNYTNDADGNTLTGGGRTNTWDSQNRMVSCAYNGNSSQYTYGADGIRRRSVVNGVTTDFALDSSMFVRELRSGASIATYLTGASGPCYRRDDVAGTVRWYLYDGLGSVLDEVDPNGNITANRKYDVYGAVRSYTGTSTSKHKFVGALGHPSEDETGLIYMQARYMDPATGTFLGEDRYRYGANWYSYADASPVNALDADGRVTFWYAIQGYGWFMLGMFLTFQAMAPTTPFLDATAMAGAAAWSFGLAATCDDMTKGLSYATGIMLGVQTLMPIIVQLIAGTKGLEACSGPIAYAAIAAACTEGLAVAGVIASIGVDTQ